MIPASLIPPDPSKLVPFVTDLLKVVSDFVQTVLKLAVGG